MDLRQLRHVVEICGTGSFSAPHEATSDLIRIKLYEEAETVVARPERPIVKESPRTPEQLLRYPLATSAGWLAPPRTFGVEANYRF